MADRGGQVQRAAAGRPLCRTRQSRHRRPAAAGQGHPADAVRRHGAADRKLDREHQEQVARGDGRGGRAAVGRRRRHRRAGRDHRRLEPLRQGWQAEVLLQLLRREPVHRRGHSRRSRRARTRCGWSSRTTAAAWRRAARSRSTSTARRPAKGVWIRPSRSIFSADETCDVGIEFGSPVTDDYPSGGTKFSGEVNWVEIDVDKDAVRSRSSHLTRGPPARRYGAAVRHLPALSRWGSGRLAVSRTLASRSRKRHVRYPAAIA